MIFEIIGADKTSIFFSAAMSILVASAFLIGSIIAIYIKYSSKLKADFASFAAGIFLAAVAFSLIDESSKLANIGTMILGFVIGAGVYSVTNHYIRKRSKYQKSEYVQRNTEKINENNRENRNRGKAESNNVIVGTILDSIPETLFVGVIIASQMHGLVGAVIALFLGNLAATLNGAKLMVEQGQNKSRVIKEWFGDFTIVAAAGPIGFFLTGLLANEYLSVIIGFAAGTLMIFISRELIPQAYGEDKGYIVDLSTVSGFLIGFVLFHYL